MQKKIILSMLTLLISGNSYALAAPTNTQYDQYQTAKRQEEEQQERINAPSVQLQTKAKSDGIVTLPKEPFRFKINNFVLEGNKDGKFNWLKSELATYKGRLIGAKGIDALAKMLSEKITARGYITTKITVPAQDVKKGTVIFTVIPGRVEAIRFAKENQYGSWRTVFPNAPGDILNVRDIEQGLEQMKRVPNQDVNVKLTPGKEQGQSIIVLDVKRTKPWSMGISFDDSGLENTGRLQATGNLALYNPTGLNDILSFSYTKDAEHEDSKKGTKNYSLSYSLPLGNYTLNINKYYNEFYQQVPTLVPFESRGKNTTYDFGLQRVLHRDNLRKTQGSFKIIKRRKESFVDGEELRIQRLNTTAYQLGLMHRQYVGKGVFDGMVYFQKGMPWFGAEPGIEGLAEGVSTTRYDLWGLNLYYGTPIKLGNIDASYSCTFRGQYTNNVLYGADQFSIGGRYSVRGFSGENSLSAENGYVLRNELSFPLKKLNMEPYFGLDYGYVFGSSDEYNLGNKLVGSVIGVRGKVATQISYDSFLGMPLYYPDGFKADQTVLGFNLYWQW